MLVELPQELLSAVVSHLDVLSKCRLACTCRSLEARAAAEWFRDEEMFMDMPEGNISAPTPAWLRRYGLKVKVDIESHDAAYEMDYLRGARVTCMQWGTENGLPRPLSRGGETLAREFPELEYLNMTRSNGPMRTFEQLGKMVSLKSLALLTDSLTGKPEALTRLTRLESLHYDVDVSEYNRDIPSFLGGMTRLTSLTLLYDNDIPNESTWNNLAPLVNLQHLALVQFDITRVPPVLSQLTQLTKVVMKRTDVPNAEEPEFMEPDGADVLQLLPRLRCLKMQQMKLVNIPLLPAGLTELALNNRRYDLDLWERLGRLTQLKNLTLEHTWIPTTARPIMAGLTSLTRLHVTAVAMTGYETFPPNLESLRLKDTTIHRIPQHISALTHLGHLFMDSALVFGGWEHVPSSVTSLMLRQDANMPGHLQSINDAVNLYNVNVDDEKYE